MFNIFLKYMHSRPCSIFYQKSIYAFFFFFFILYDFNWFSCFILCNCFIVTVIASNIALNAVMAIQIKCISKYYSVSLDCIFVPYECKRITST